MKIQIFEYVCLKGSKRYKALSGGVGICDSDSFEVCDRAAIRALKATENLPLRGRILKREYGI